MATYRKTRFLYLRNARDSKAKSDENERMEEEKEEVEEEEAEEVDTILAISVEHSSDNPIIQICWFVYPTPLTGICCHGPHESI